MDYEAQLRAMLLRYPNKAEEVKIFIEPSISNCCKGYLNDLGTYYKEVDSPEEADFIPVWLDYKERCSKEIWNWVEKYPEKCLSAFNYLNAVNAEMPEATEDDLDNVKRLLSANDWESFYLGLSILRSFYLDDNLKNIVRDLLSTLSVNCMDNTASIKPLNKDNAITIHDLDIVKEYEIWLKNKFLKYGNS